MGSEMCIRDSVGADLGEAELRVLHEVESTHAEEDKVEQDAEVPRACLAAACAAAAAQRATRARACAAEAGPFPAARRAAAAATAPHIGAWKALQLTRSSLSDPLSPSVSVEWGRRLFVGLWLASRFSLCVL